MHFKMPLHPKGNKSKGIMKKTIQKLSPFLLALFFSASASAQNFGTIKGKITGPDGEPAGFATVHVDHKGGLIGTTADIDGRFTLKPLDPGTYTVHVNHVGANPYEYNGVVVGADRFTFLNDIELQANTLGVVVVTGHTFTTPLIDPEQPQKLQVTRSEIKDNALAKNPVKLVSTISPNIYQDPSSGELHFKGSRTGSMAFYVDGVKITDGLRGVPPKSIQTITVYSGGIPARYGDITGGVVAIETRSYFDLYAEMNAARFAAKEKANEPANP